MTPVTSRKLKNHLQNQLRKTFKRTIDNPVVKAHESWGLLSEQLLAILGPEVHTQWFEPVTPLVLKNNILLLQTKSNFSSQWINTHYQELIDVLVKTQDKKMTSFFISPKKEKVKKRLIENI